MSRLLLPVLIIIRTLIMCMLFYYRSWINFTVLFRPARSRKVGRVWEMAPCGASLLLASEAKLGRALQTTRRRLLPNKVFFFFRVSLVYSAARRRCFSCHFRRVRFFIFFISFSLFWFWLLDGLQRGSGRTPFRPDRSSVALVLHLFTVHRQAPCVWRHIWIST